MALPPVLLPVHWLLTQHWSAPQAFPQAPQLSWFWSSHTQAFPPQSVAPSPQALQTPATQVPLAPVQTLPQAPQLSLSFLRSAHWSLHCVSWVGHTPQVPPLHT